jgi:hypothetical protein
MKADLLARHDWPDLIEAPRRFDDYQRLSNHDRPHQALDLATPASRYPPSPPGTLPERPLEPEYELGLCVRTVKSKGELPFKNRFYYVSRTFTGLPLVLRPTATDGLFQLCYAAFTLGLIGSTKTFRPAQR